MAISLLTPYQKEILALLGADKDFSNNFYFTGGTALAEYYLKHRYSEDLDFFTKQEVDNLWLTTITKFLKGKLKANKVDIQQSFNRNLVFFTHKTEILKTEFTYFPFPQITSPRVIDGIKIDSLVDIAVNKFFTIYQNPSARHFIDLYLIIKSKKVKWEDLSGLARKKFDTHIDPIQLGSQLVTAEDVQDFPRMIVKLSDLEWRNYFISQAKQLKSKIAKQA